MAVVLTDEIASAQAQIGRADTKASILTGLALAALTGGTALAHSLHLHGLAVAGAVLALAFDAAALVLLGTAIRPDLRGYYGFVRWADQPTVTDLHHALLDSDPSDDGLCHLWLICRSAERKYRRIRLAVDLLAAALATAGLTAILSALGW